MKAQFSSTALVACLVALFFTIADARPLSRRRGMITLPLKPITQAQHAGDLHPQVLLQQHINRARVRVSHMTRSPKPSDEELRDQLVKRFEGVSASGLVSRQDKCAGDAPPPECNNSLKLNIIANDVGYFATVELGTPSRDFRLLMDSGSADLWVGGENCRTDEAGGGGDCGPHTFLGPKSSSSFIDMKVPFEVTYGGGHVEGTKVLDRFTFGGLRIPNLQFGVATLESTDFSGDDVPFDGLMGLALSSLSELQGPTAIETLAASGLIDEAIVSYRIPRRKDNTDDGSITFGGLDDSKYDSETLVTLPNISPIGFWVAQADNSTVDGKDTGIGRREALLDTGTTLFAAPRADVEKIHSLIDGTSTDEFGRFHVPCDTNATVALSFGGLSFEIDSRDLVFANLGDGDCLSGIGTVEGLANNSWLVGDTFLKNVYFSTNAKTNEISLAKLV
ncbi:aspartic peptidase a1 [Moniliophthora roreri MCA 2997]|uniref:Aspartic peptidase a1 n=2 Tax=Moniliophthora roreri TaxID=221103 RepID=V2XF24_MONRO|nr:aspartic peptidase a1 [Moniliophthora roreri MCA 2997]KAI3613830.1 aspartic peptidase a1 [Moniliophthora roreri]